MDNKIENKGRSGIRRTMIALISCAFGAGLILFAVQLTSTSPDKNATAGKESSAEAKKKTQRAWNIALGNVVVIAPDLGLSAKSLKGGQVDNSKISPDSKVSYRVYVNSITRRARKIQPSWVACCFN